MTLVVTCAIIVDGMQVLCALRGPGMRLAGEWEFPGGKLEAHESAEECIVREIVEELQLQVEVMERGPSVLHPYQPGRWLQLIPFVCQVVGGELQLREHAEVRWCLPAEMAQLHWAQADLGIVDWWLGRMQDVSTHAANEGI
jgi:8-oxo-dGTP diphosphatase